MSSKLLGFKSRCKLNESIDQSTNIQLDLENTNTLALWIYLTPRKSWYVKYRIWSSVRIFEPFWWDISWERSVSINVSIKYLEQIIFLCEDNQQTFSFPYEHISHLINRAGLQNLNNIDDLSYKEILFFTINTYYQHNCWIDFHWQHTFSCFSRWRIRISRSVRWQVVIEMNGEIFFIATLFIVCESNAELKFFFNIDWFRSFWIHLQFIDLHDHTICTRC